MLYNGTKTIPDWTSVHKERRFRRRDFFKGAKLPPSRFLTTGVTFWMGFYGIVDSFNFVSVQYGLALRYDNIHLLQNFFILSFLSNLISSSSRTLSSEQESGSLAQGLKRGGSWSRIPTPFSRKSLIPLSFSEPTKQTFLGVRHAFLPHQWGRNA